MLDDMYVKVKIIGLNCPKKVHGSMQIAPNFDRILPH